MALQSGSAGVQAPITWQATFWENERGGASSDERLLAIRGQDLDKQNDHGCQRVSTDKLISNNYLGRSFGNLYPK